MSAADVLQRLEGVRETGAGRWVARCPGTMTAGRRWRYVILDDGMCWCTDFAECPVDDVLAALGLTFMRLVSAAPD